MKQPGFTLIEVLVATIITTALLLAVMGFAAARIAHNAHQSARDDMLRQTQQALDIMMDDIRHASHVDGENRWEDDHAPGGQFSWESTEDTLILARPATDSNNDFIYEDPLTYITHKDNLVYFTDNSVLYKRTLAADTGDDGENGTTTSCPEGTSGCRSDARLAENVTNFHVRYIDADGNDTEPTSARAVEATLEVGDTVYGREVSADYTTRAVFRN